MRKRFHRGDGPGSQLGKLLSHAFLHGFIFIKSYEKHVFHFLQFDLTVTKLLLYFLFLNFVYLCLKALFTVEMYWNFWWEMFIFFNRFYGFVSPVFFVSLRSSWLNIRPQLAVPFSYAYTSLRCSCKEAYGMGKWGCRGVSHVSTGRLNLSAHNTSLKLMMLKCCLIFVFTCRIKVDVFHWLISFNKVAWEILKCILLYFLCLLALLCTRLEFFFENLRAHTRV